MTILINADGYPGVSDVMKNKTSSRTLPLIRLNLRLLAEMVDILPQTKPQPAGLVACGLRTAALFSSAPSSRKKGTSLSRCLLLAEMVGILPRAKQQSAGLIACGLRTAALFSSAPSLPQKRHQPKPVPFIGGDGGIRTHVPD